MKNTILFFCSLIFGIFNAQSSDTLLTTSQIDFKIEKVKNLSWTAPDQAIAISNDIFRTSKNMGYKNGMLESGSLLMARYFDTGNFKKILDMGEEVEKLAMETKNDIVLSNTYRLKASAYTELGLNDESIKEFKKALKITDRIKSTNDRNYLKAITYIGMGSYAAHVNMPIDSVIHYQKMSLASAMKINDDENFASKRYHILALSYINLGKTSVASHRLKDAEIYFSKALKIFQNKENTSDKNLEVTIYNEFAWFYYDQKKYDRSIQYAITAEKLEKQVSSPYIRRDIYEVYFKSYVELGEKAASTKYMNLYSKLNDSLVNAEKKIISIPVTKMMKEKDHIHTTNTRRIILLLIGILIIILGVGLFLWNRNQRKHKVKYEEIVRRLANQKNSLTEKNESSSIAEKGIGITDETMNILFLKLEKFEKSQKFIKNDVSLTSLANDLGTNTRYLSEVIKQYKGKNYNNYINSLRINYITTKLYENPIYREYKISYLAEACGFSSREVFAVIFKKETGITPSYFISDLKKKYQESAS
ncbi:AraC family transcriptional regulator [Chryseobacterium sp. MYb328]|uniref:AraC family transcriptional regulator n=1 Tax=Chryseobacterium sp. MYb328 TaxID=2745231 RepID=UPI0030AB695C